MTKAIKTTKTACVTDAEFAKLRDSIHRRADTIQGDIHRYLVAVAVRWEKSGDNRDTAGHADRVNSLLHELPKGIRGNAIREWVSKHLKLTFVTEDTPAKNTFVMGTAKAKELDLDALSAERWYDLKPEPAYKPIDLAADMERMLKAAIKRRDVATEDDNIPTELLTSLQAAMAAFNNAQLEANCPH